MRLEDLRDFWTLRRLTENPWEVLRFRKDKDGAVEVKFRERPSLHLRGDRADFHIFHRIYLRDEYRLESLLASDDCVLDLGGNVGLFSARVAPFVDRVIVYEPFPDNMKALEANTVGFGNVVRVQAAVSGEAGTLDLFLPNTPETSGVYTVLPEGKKLLSQQSIQVEAVTLDQVFEQHGIERCALMKIDVEGAEYEILGRASRSTLDKIQRIHGEYHDVQPATPENRIEGFESFLTELGFRMEVLPHKRKPNHGMFFATR